MLTRDLPFERRTAFTITVALLAYALGSGGTLAQTSKLLPAERFSDWFLGGPAPTFTHPEVISLLVGLPFPRDGADEDGIVIAEAGAASGPAERASTVSALQSLFAPRAEAATPSLPPQAGVPFTHPSDAPSPPAANADPSRADVAAVGSVSPRSRVDSRSRAEASRSGRKIGSGRAVWYEHPGRTASDERFNPDRLTAAHRSLPFGSRVRVVNRRNGRSVVIRINDRGPPQPNLLIDLSRASAQALGITGVATVVLYKID